MVDAVADPEHLEAVRHLAAAARVEVRRLVRQGQVGEARLEVAELDRHVLRLDARARQVDHVEVLRQPDEVAEVGQVARALAAVEVADGGRAADRHGGEVAAAESDVPLRRAAEDLHRLRRRGERLLDEPGLEPDHLRLLVDARARRRGKARASGRRTRMPCSSRIVSADSWRCATWSALRISIGGNGFSSER